MRAWWGMLVVIAALAACGQEDHDELKRWMAENTRDLRGKVPKLPEMKPYVAVPYDAESVVDPFKPARIDPESKANASAGQAGKFQPDFAAREKRKKAPATLEKYPLESMRMIGSMNINRQPMAIVQVEDKVQQVRVGDYLGLDFGMVTKITDTEIQLRELIQDSAGEWSERKSTLLLQAREESRK